MSAETTVDSLARELRKAAGHSVSTELLAALLCALRTNSNDETRDMALYSFCARLAQLEADTRRINDLLASGRLGMAGDRPTYRGGARPFDRLASRAEIDAALARHAAAGGSDTDQ